MFKDTTEFVVIVLLEALCAAIDVVLKGSDDNVSK